MFQFFRIEFPELVAHTGEGWFYAHIRGITKFAKNNKTLISVKAMETISAISKGFTKVWTKKVKQMQVPPFALNTKGAWVLRFDDIIPDTILEREVASGICRVKLKI